MTDDDSPFRGITMGIHRATHVLLQSTSLSHQPWTTAAAHCLAYLDAVTPVGHPARPHLLELRDFGRWSVVHGDPDKYGATLAGAAVARLAEAYDRALPEVYTLNSRSDVDTWLPGEDRADLTARLVAPSADYQASCSALGDRLDAGHRTPTLVFYTAGLPHAQVSLPRLLQVASNSDAVRLASHIHDRCGHRDCTCDPQYVVKTADNLLLVTCTTHLSHALHPNGGYVIGLSPS